MPTIKQAYLVSSCGLLKTMCVLSPSMRRNASCSLPNHSADSSIHRAIKKANSAPSSFSHTVVCSPQLMPFPMRASGVSDKDEIRHLCCKPSSQNIMSLTLKSHTFSTLKTLFRTTA